MSDGTEVQLSCTNWCVSMLDLIDDIVNSQTCIESSPPPPPPSSSPPPTPTPETPARQPNSTDIFLKIAQRMNFPLDGKALAPSQLPKPHLEQQVHSLSKQLACWVLLHLRCTDNAFAHREYYFMLKSMQDMLSHAHSAIHKTFVEPVSQSQPQSQQPQQQPQQ